MPEATIICEETVVEVRLKKIICNSFNNCLPAGWNNDENTLIAQVSRGCCTTFSAKFFVPWGLCGVPFLTTAAQRGTEVFADKKKYGHVFALCNAHVSLVLRQSGKPERRLRLHQSVEFNARVHFKAILKFGIAEVRKRVKNPLTGLVIYVLDIVTTVTITVATSLMICNQHKALQVPFPLPLFIPLQLAKQPCDSYCRLVA